MTVPPRKDDEGSAVTIVVTDLSSSSSFPQVAFTIDIDEIIFKPVAFSEVGVHKMEVKLKDDGFIPSSYSSSMTFDVTVVNDLPQFTKTPFDTVKMPVNSTLNHSITEIFDYNSHHITMTI